MGSEEYRERPRTGTNAGPAGTAPEAVDPSVLTDDRENESLLVFEKTWGHRLLAGLGITMLVVGAVLIVYCAIRLSNFVPLATGEGGMVTLGLVLYGVGLTGGILIIPPALIALWVSRKPRHALVAIVFAVIALVLVAGFIVYALSVGSPVLTVLLYALLFAILPALYLAASIKIRRSR